MKEHWHCSEQVNDQRCQVTNTSRNHIRGFIFEQCWNVEAANRQGEEAEMHFNFGLMIH